MPPPRIPRSPPAAALVPGIGRRTPAAEPRLMPGGEAIKNDWPAVQGLIAEMLRLHLDRHAFVLIVGGGAVLDAVGFAASLVHRGLAAIRIPTTALRNATAAWA